MVGLNGSLLGPLRKKIFGVCRASKTTTNFTSFGSHTCCLFSLNLLTVVAVVWILLTSDRRRGEVGRCSRRHWKSNCTTNSTDRICQEILPWELTFLLFVSLLVPPHRWMEVIRSATSSASRTRALSHKEPHAYWQLNKPLCWLSSSCWFSREHLKLFFSLQV